MSPRAAVAGKLTRLLDAGWVMATGVTCAAGIFSAWQRTGIAVVLAVFLVGAALGASFVIPWIPTLTWRSRPLIIGGPGAGMVTVVAFGLVGLIGPTTIAVVALLILSAPGTRAAVAALLAGPLHLRGAQRPLASREQPSPEESGPVRLPPLQLDEPFVVPDVMTDEDLCHAWRSSYVALCRATTVSSQLRVVQMRALYLDELERRAGPALRSWFFSGARAAGDPTRSLAARPRAGSRPSSAEPTG